MTTPSPIAHADTHAARRSGTFLVIAGVPLATPQDPSPSPYTAITKRDDFERTLLEAFEMEAAVRDGIEGSLPDQAKAYLASAHGQDDRDKEAQFLSALTMMLMATMTGSPDLAPASGLMAIALAVDPDESLGWKERGMLEPSLMDRVAAAGRPAPRN